MPQIYDMGPTALFPLRSKACWEFFRPKNPTASAGFEPANLVTKGQHATPRPMKPHTITIWSKRRVSFKNQDNEHSKAEDLILTLMHTCHMRSRWYTPDNHVLTAEVYPFKRQVKSHLLAILGAHHILHFSRVRIKNSSRRRINRSQESVARTGKLASQRCLLEVVFQPGASEGVQRDEYYWAPYWQ